MSKPLQQSRTERGWPRGLLLSLLLHSLPLLSLIAWHPTPAEIPSPIPIQLVIEQPPPPPPPAKPEPAPSSPPIRSASADFAEHAAPKVEQGVNDAPPEPAEPPPPVEAQTPAAAPPSPAETKAAAAEPPPPQPAPSPSEEPAQPPAVEIKTAAVVPPPLPPKRTPHKQQTTLEMPLASAWPLPLHQDNPHAAQRFASLVGPAAVRDEYCVRALNLTLRHLDLVPLSFLGGRRGTTVVTIRILGDGTINSVKLAQSSGYPDIDQRIERMVFAVGRYPPLPPRIPGTWSDFTFVMVFPDASQR
jgi:periplasmic protein TonB